MSVEQLNDLEMGRFPKLCRVSIELLIHCTKMRSPERKAIGGVKWIGVVDHQMEGLWQSVEA